MSFDNSDPSRQPPPRLTTNYALIFIVVLAAVITGNLILNWMDNRARLEAIHQIGQQGVKQMNDIAAQAKATTERLKREQQATQQQQREETRQQRITSQTGQKLAQACTNWTQTHAQLKSSYAEMEKNRVCTQLQHYIDTGNTQ